MKVLQLAVVDGLLYALMSDGKIYFMLEGDWIDLVLPGEDE